LFKKKTHPFTKNISSSRLAFCKLSGILPEDLGAEGSLGLGRKLDAWPTFGTVSFWTRLTALTLHEKERRSYRQQPRPETIPQNLQELNDK